MGRPVPWLPIGGKSVRSSVLFGVGVTALVATLSVRPVSAQSLMDTLSLAYSNNPTLNAARSTGRATDEGVPIALSGYRPTINGSLSAGATDQYNLSYPGYQESRRQFWPQQMSLTLVQPLFTGFRVENGVKQSEAAVRAQREVIRDTEQTVLLRAATAFGDMIRDTALLRLAESNVKFLSEQVRADTDRFNVGEGTRTDVARAEASLQQGIAQVNSAKSQLALSRATYRQVVGVEPKTLNGTLSLAPFLPKTSDIGVKTALEEHPAIQASLHNMDVASFNVKVLEGQLLPTLSAQAGVSYGEQPSSSSERSNSAQVSLNLTVPLYQGGAEYARVRQAKEQLGTARIQVDVNRDQVRAQVIGYWGQLEAARASIEAAKAQTEAADLALSGVVEEQRVGQKTNVDVLNAQATVVNARSALATAQRNQLVASFSLVAAIGRLDAAHLKLKAARYAPEEHYTAVRDKWIGLRTPDGR
jgi:outer membrane protein